MLTAAIIALVVAATAATAAAASSSSPAVPRSAWPARWKAKPSPAIAQAALAGERQYQTPAALLLAAGLRETLFRPIRGVRHGGNHGLKWGSPRPGYYESWLARRDQLIPGSRITWGQMFPRPEDWRPYGVWQCNPYVLVPDFVPAGAPLARLLDVRAGALAAARLLARYYQERGSWFKALLRYNASPSWRQDVVDNYTALGLPRSNLEAPVG